MSALIHNQQLNARETQMLIAIFQQLSEKPELLDYEKLAAETSQKFAKNAKDNTRKLFKKLKEADVNKATANMPALKPKRRRPSATRATTTREYESEDDEKDDEEEDSEDSIMNINAERYRPVKKRVGKETGPKKVVTFKEDKKVPAAKGPRKIYANRDPIIAKVAAARAAARAKDMELEANEGLDEEETNADHSQMNYDFE